MEDQDNIHQIFADNNPTLRIGKGWSNMRCLIENVIPHQQSMLFVEWPSLLTYKKRGLVSILAWVISVQFWEPINSLSWPRNSQSSLYLISLPYRTRRPLSLLELHGHTPRGEGCSNMRQILETRRRLPEREFNMVLAFCESSGIATQPKALVVDVGSTSQLSSACCQPLTTQSRANWPETTLRSSRLWEFQELLGRRRGSTCSRNSTGITQASIEHGPRFL